MGAEHTENNRNYKEFQPMKTSLHWITQDLRDLDGPCNSTTLQLGGFINVFYATIRWARSSHKDGRMAQNKLKGKSDILGSLHLENK